MLNLIKILMTSNPARPNLTAMALLNMGVWFGLLTGVGELALLGARKFVLGNVLFLGHDVIWMAPLANVVVFGIVGLVIYALARRWPGLIPPGAAIFVYAFTGFAALLFMYGPLHRLAALLLAVGLATVTSRVLTAYPGILNMLVWLTAWWSWIPLRRRRDSDIQEDVVPAGDSGLRLDRRQFMLGAGATVAGLALGVHGWRRFDEWRALSALPSSTTRMPNVLLIVMDTVRADSLSLYGYSRATTPRMERIARMGARFDRAVSTASWTLPSHASMFTGRYPHEINADWLTPLDRTHTTLAEFMGEHGYATGGFVANLLYCTYETGLDRGFAHYEDYTASPGQVVAHSSLGRTVASSDWYQKLTGNHQILGRKSAAQVNRDFLDWASRDSGRPFFAFLNYFDAHNPYLPPEPFDEMFGPERPDRNPQIWAGRNMSPDEIKTEQNAYDGAIAYIDHQIGLLFDELQRRQMLDDTLVIITADHGEHFGEHRLMGHGTSLYWQQVHVPLLMLYSRRVPSGVIVDRSASLRDLPATIADIAGLRAGASFPGSSLARFWNSDGSRTDAPDEEAISALSSAPEDLPEWYPVSGGDIKSVVKGNLHYIKNGDGSEELYDISGDPLEEHNLSDTAEGRHALAQFRASLETELARSS